MLRQLAICCSVLMSAGPALGQSAAPTDRERAVAIDRTPIPPIDPYEVEEIGPPLAAPWSLAFLPDGSFLVSEKHGGVRRIAPNGRATAAFEGGPPNVFRKEDSGLLDIVLDPEFATNQTIYLAFAEGTEEANRTALWKARLNGDRMVDGRVIFRVAEAKRAPSHPGGRMLFLPDKTLLLTVGDGFNYRDRAQDTASHLGKILRLTRDGHAAADNPFVGRPGYAPEIWTLGHRNVQGITRDPVSGTIWSHEHGPRGGDEINELVAGRNYGWPTVSFGIDYDGTVITDRAHAPGMTDSRFVWSPSIAPSGLVLYRGTAFPEWDGKLLIGALAARALVQVRIGAKTGLLAEEGRWLTGLKARVRDVRVGPDGALYLLTSDDSGRLLRVVKPSEQAATPAAHSLSPLGYMIGQWSGESRITPAFRENASPVDERSLIECAPALAASYIRCTARFYRKRDGRLRTVERYINRNPAKSGFDVLLINSNWPGKTSYTQNWSEQEQAWVANLPTEHEGRPATERIVDKPSTDRTTILHTESIRLNSRPEAPWTETFRWTWTRRGS